MTHGTLSEVEIPDGYAKADDIKISVSKDGELFINGTRQADASIEMIDSVKKGFSINKVDSSGNPVIGAELSLSDSKSGNVIGAWETGEKPHEVQLETGKIYILSETKVPLGYMKADDMHISVSEDGKLIIDGSEAGSDEIKMVDELKPYALPSTGRNGKSPLPLLFLPVFFLLFFASSGSQAKRKHR